MLTIRVGLHILLDFVTDYDKRYYGEYEKKSFYHFLSSSSKAQVIQYRFPMKVTMASQLYQDPHVIRAQAPMKDPNAIINKSNVFILFSL